MKRLLASLLLPAIAVGQTAQLGAVADTTIFSESDTTSDGAGQYFFSGRTNQSPPAMRRALLKFDIAGAVPAGSTITSAALTLYMSRSKPGTDPVALHRAIKSWGEGLSDGTAEEGQGAPAQLNDATWRYCYFQPLNPPASPAWTSLGGDYVAAASASIPVGTVNASYTWGSNAAMAADVQLWLNNPASNYGWILIGDESANRTTSRFNSRQNPDGATRPLLVVTYIPPATSGACCLTGGACQLFTSTQCAAQSGTYQGNGTGCSPSPCPQPTGACCSAGGACSVLTAAACTSQAGVFQGNSTACSPNPCPIPTGACCFNNASCQVLTQASCAGQNGVYRGDNTACSAGLCPLVLAPFVDPLPIPAVMQPVSGTVGGQAEYIVSVTEFNQRLHRELPPTRVWGYGGSYPGPTIEAGRGLPVDVTWVNDLRDPQGVLRTHHYLPVDTCLQGPNTAGDAPRIVPHLHGGHVPQNSDGYPTATILPGQSTAEYHYPNTQPPATIWYHDHAMGITRLNVYMGLAGFYIIRDSFEQGLGLPSGQYEIGLAIQDRSFNPDGSLKYPGAWQEDFFGDVMLVNGKVWPYLNVRQGKYRFRVLEGCNSRTLTLSLSNGATFWQIGTDLGLLGAPVPMTQLTIAPGERADIVIDFAGYAAGTEIILTNSAAAPYPGVGGAIPNVLQFVVTNQNGHTGPLPTSLRPVAPIAESTAALTREFSLRRITGPCGPTWAINDLMFDDITERPRLDTNEIWSFVNRSGMMHPMHMHLVQFQVLDRQPFQVVSGVVTPTGPRVPPPPNEAGWKDTARSNPDEILRVIARFEDFTGPYPYHCHILEHEDNEMMRQFAATCYANCDASTASPALSVQDFSCFLNSFASGDPYANCDDSTVPPILNVQDFSCFLNKFAQACP